MSISYHLKEKRMIFIKDIIRCPYAPKEPEYDAWSKKDKERIDKLVEDRKALLREAKGILNGNYQGAWAQKMAEFIVFMLDE